MALQDDFKKLTVPQSGLVGFVLAAIYFFVIFDDGAVQRSAMERTNVEIQDKQQRLEKLNITMSNKAAFEEQVADLSKNLEQLMKYFPQNLDMVLIEKKITQLLEKSGSSLDNLERAEVEARYPGYDESGVKLTVKGSFHSIMVFLSSLTSMSRVVDFSKMSIDDEGSNDDFSKVKLELTLSVFSQGVAPPPKVEEF